MLLCWGHVRARTRIGDLFLTKWSLDPGEFQLILAPSSRCGRDHLPKKGGGAFQ